MAASAASGKGRGGRSRGASSKSSSVSELGPDGDDRTERMSWTRKEDETIARSVSELGNKWHQIAERLPGRTEHAIRNRYARLMALSSRGTPIVLTSGEGLPIGIQLVPSTTLAVKSVE